MKLLGNIVNFLFDKSNVEKSLAEFFSAQKANILSFGSTVNQTFEAYVFAQCIKSCQKRGWIVSIKNPSSGKFKDKFRLKFSTRGAPSNFSYAIAEKNYYKIQIHHGLRVETAYNHMSSNGRANICLDVAIITETDVSYQSSDDAIPNSALLSFGEAKHMSAYAELVAGFLGLVHEMLPDALTPYFGEKEGVEKPFLYVSGHLYGTAYGIAETITARGFFVNIYSFDNKM